MPKVNFSCFDDDDEPDSLLRPCFQIGDDVELKEIPTSGEEYLLTVITERKNVLEVTKCDVDLTQFRDKQSRFVEEIPIAPVPIKLKPTIEWQNIQVADFSEVRMTLSPLQLNPSKLKFKIYKSVITNETDKCWLSFFHEKEANLSVLLGLTQLQLERGLERLTQVVQKTPTEEHITHKTGQWIYGFLSCLKQPLLADTQSSIRELARQCAIKRAQIDPDREDAVKLVTPYNLFICLVAKYFGQFDLAD